MKLRSAFVAIALVTAPAAFIAPAFADVAPVYTKKNSDLALNGYDAVAYFTVGEPTEGSADFSTEYQGALFQFSSRENLDLFLAAPDQYAPQYGGYCAWAAANGKSAAGNPKHWAIVDGRLFLNYNGRIQRRWNADQANFIARADAAWPEVVGASASTPAPAPSTTAAPQRPSHGS